MPAFMAGRLRDLENTKFVIRALLMVNNGPTPYEKFVKDYRRTEGHYVPYQKYGYPDCLDFLRSLTDAVHVKQQGDDVLLLPNLDDGAGENVRHVQELIKAQRIEPAREDQQQKRPETARPARKAALHVPDNVQRNLQGLVSKFMHGIFLDALEDAYLREFGTALNVGHLGFVSLKEALTTVQFFDLVSMPNNKIKVRLRSSSDKVRKTAVRGKSPTARENVANGHMPSAKSPDAWTAEASLLRHNIQRLLERRTDGIFMSSFSQAYADEVGEELSVGTMQLVQRWPDLFHIVRPDSSSDFIVFPGTLADPADDGSADDPCAPAPSSTADAEYAPVQLPADASDEYFPVRVSHIGSPGRFAIRPVAADGCDPLAALARDMRELYDGHAGHRYVVAGGRSAVRVGQAYAARYASVDDNAAWYRARVTGLPNLHNVEVELVDLGGRSTVQRCELRRLREDFLALPAQCARAALAFLRPAGDEWCERAYKCLLQLSADRVLMCKVEGCDEGGTLRVLLCDTNGDEEHFVHDVLVREGLARCDLPPPPVRPHGEANGSTPADRGRGVDVRRLRLGDGSAIHLIRLGSRDYVASQEVSSLVGWRRDCVLDELDKKGISFGHLVVESDREPELFAKMEGFAPGRSAHLFKASSVVDVVNLFNYPSAELVAEIRRLLELSSGAASSGGNEARRKRATQLERLGERLAAANDERRQIYSSLGTGAMSVDHVDLLQDIETRIVGLQEQIEKLRQKSL